MNYLEQVKEEMGNSSRQWWESIFESNDDAMVVCAQNGSIIKANRRARQGLLFRAFTNQSHSVNLLNFLTEETAGKVVDILNKKNGSQPYLSAVSVINTDEILAIADLIFTPLKNDCWLVTIRDVSRRWRMEAHVNRLLAAVEVTRDIVFLTDSNLRIIFTNPAFQAITGYTLEDTLGRSSEFLRAPEERQRYRECLKLIKNGYDWEGEFVNIKSDGTHYVVSACISPIYDKEGNFLGLASFEKDITRQKELEAELVLERNYISSIVNCIDAAVYTTDKEFKIFHVNDGWKTFPPHHGHLCVTSPPETGKSFFEYVTDETKRDELKAIFESVMKDGKPRELRINHNEKCWSVKISSWQINGDSKGIIYMVSDQTKFHDLERQLFQAQKMETVGALAAGVAHDFNNLLMAIQVNSSLLLLRDDLDKSLKNIVKEIETASQKAAAITKQLLSFSRPSNDQDIVVDFNVIVEEAKQLFQTSLRQNIEVRIVPAEPSPRVLINPTRAHQVLLNLFINAQDAMPHGGKIYVKNSYKSLTHEQAIKARKPAGSLFLCCSVSDTGTGIPPEIMPKIFEPFFTTKEKGKGTGLGLSIVQSIVIQSGGFIEVSSVVGEGTTFDIYLPITTEEVQTVPQQTETKIYKGHGRLLVVDDIDLVLEVAHRFLTILGYEVLVAHDAEEALQIIYSQDKPIDLLFTDYNMSGKNGIELIYEVREMYPDMKFILTSGYIGEEEKNEIQQLPGVRILQKPYNVREAAELIGLLLNQGKEDKKNN